MSDDEPDELPDITNLPRLQCTAADVALPRAYDPHGSGIQTLFEFGLHWGVLTSFESTPK
jgi:hypothetical protein